MKRARLQAAQAELAIAEQSVRRLKAEIDELQCEIQKEHGDLM
jgi:multidrug resistance efflux pump